MKRLLLLLIFFPVAMFAQSNHSVTLSWTASPDAAANPTGTYTIYRAPALCTPAPASSAFLKQGTAPGTALGFTDSAIPLGNYCYVITFTVNGAESVQSVLTEARVLPSPPTGVVATVK